MGLFSGKVAIDLGTAYSVIAHGQSSELWRIPSSIAFDLESDKAVAFGDDAKEMMGRCPDRYEVVRPLKDGVIANFDATNEYLTHLLAKALRGTFSLKYTIFLCVPWGATAVELRSYIQGLKRSRRKVQIIREPFAALLGCGHDLLSDKPATVVDMGGGTTEVATICSGYMMNATSLRASGAYCDQLIIDAFRREFNFNLGLQSAERIKIEHGSVWPVQESYEFRVRGNRRETSLPEEFVLKNDDMRSFLEGFAVLVENKIREHLSQLPTDAKREVELNGLYLAGGTSMLRGWKERIETRLGIPVVAVPDPAYAVIRGMQEIIKNSKHYEEVLRISNEVVSS